MQTTEVLEINNKLAKEYPFDNTANEIFHSAMPIYPANRGYYIWYRDSIPAEIDTSIISDEYELLYQSVNLTEYKSRLNMYVSVYSACLTIVILILLSSPFLPDALATFQAGKSTVMVKEGTIPVTTVDQFTETSQNTESVEGISRNSLGFTDLKNNVMYVLLPNGKYSIQESSWNIEEKAVKRVDRINSLGIKYPDGKTLKAVIEKADLPSKGVWFRTRLGEFSTIKDAIVTAQMIRAEEKIKNLSDLYIFPVSNLKV